MMSTFFNTSKIGMTLENPILMDSISSSYAYLNCLCSITEGLSCKRIGSTGTSNFANPIDKYVFTLNNDFFCIIFIYPYHKKSVCSIPEPFFIYVNYFTIRCFLKLENEINN